MGFRFRLDTVLRHRGRVVDDRSREVAAAEDRLRRLDDQVLELERDLKQAYAEEKFPEGSPLHLGDLVAKRRWLEHLGNRKDQMTTLRDHAEADRDQARRRLQEAWRQHEVLDRLRTRREKNHRDRQVRMETLAMDEIASVRHPSSRPAHSSGKAAGSSLCHEAGSSGTG
jgi:flagellar export protein FliJ